MLKALDREIPSFRELLRKEVPVGKKSERLLFKAVDIYPEKKEKKEVVSKKEQKSSAKEEAVKQKQKPAEKIEIIAYEPDNCQQYGREYACWVNVNFNAKDVKAIRVWFSSSDFGVNFRIRLLAGSMTPDNRNGLNQKKYTIPKGNNYIEIPIKEFPLYGNNDVWQISVHSGAGTWGIPLDQGPDDHAVFEKIELVKSSSAGISIIEDEDPLKRELLFGAKVSLPSLTLFPKTLSNNLLVYQKQDFDIAA